MTGRITPGPWPKNGKMPGKGTIFICPSVPDGGVFEWLANRELIARAPEMEARIQELEAALEDFRDHGCRHDVHPTCADGREPAGGWYRYTESMDRGVRDRARAALSKQTRLDER